MRNTHSVHLQVEHLETRIALNADAVYVWRGPGLGGTPIDQAAATRLVSWAQSEGIKRVFFDGWGDGSSNAASGQLANTAEFRSIIRTLRNGGLSVEALFSESNSATAPRIEAVRQYNAAVASSDQFNGVRINYEGPWAVGNSPTKPEDIQYFANLKAQAQGSFPVSISIAHWWDGAVTYNEVSKPAYQHIVDVTDGIDIQAYFDTASMISTVSRDEIAYARSVNKPADISVETQDVVARGLGTAANTFFEEGRNVMRQRLSQVSIPGLTTPRFAFHYYGKAFGSQSSSLPLWNMMGNLGGGGSTGGSDPFTVSGNTLTVRGTTGNDTFNVVPGSTHQVTLNGVTRSFSGATITAIRLEGNGGTDSATLNGTNGNERAVLRPMNSTLNGPGYAITAINVASVTINAGLGTDFAELWDSAGNDTYQATPTSLTMSGAGFMLRANGFDEALAQARNGGFDTATLTGSALDDLFVADPNQGYLRGSGFNNRFSGFDSVTAKGNGGRDVAHLAGNSGRNTFIGNGSGATLSGSGYQLDAVGFGDVYAYGAMSNDNVFRFTGITFRPWIGSGSWRPL